ncbi:HU family DNA-binding protein [Gemmobacter sp.]|uniref:HU family DNA-binding protein n=1 Tax=Gemmobacter sp. TaxID=1898957 RepID=UPI002B003834|nr:HU family DNA-binding protein [Gemmobacter sp.]
MAKPAKPATAPRPNRTPGAAGKIKAAAPVPATPIEGPVEGGVLKAKDLLERVAARAGANKKQAKPFMDAVLHEIGASLARGESFILPPLGRGKLRPRKEGATGEGVMLKLLPVKSKKEGETPLAPAEE